MKKLFISVIIILIAAIKTYADCFTGFACSIKDLEQEEINLSIELYKKYINENKKNFTLSEWNKPFRYKDLFIFNTFV